MAGNGRRGFTLIELLVVIAIIGILAAMLFPVFARARESARKIQCLANVKNICLAIQMYLADYNDACPPGEASADAEAYFISASPRGKTSCDRQEGGNPYLRWPVVFDEYVKNRDVWRCPSAKLPGGAGLIVDPVSYGSWISAWRANQGVWTSDVNTYGPCKWAWPSGWGGDVTDSFRQKRLAGNEVGKPAARGNGAFEMGIGLTCPEGLNMSAVNDAARRVMVSDGGPGAVNNSHWSALAIPDICGMDCTMCCKQYDWTNCPAKAANSDCVNLIYSMAPDDGSMFRPEVMAKFARHMGGSNIGFLDGHARWMSAGAIKAAWMAGDLEGVNSSCCGTPSKFRF